jgi:hypothetical protein
VDATEWEERTVSAAEPDSRDLEMRGERAHFGIFVGVGSESDDERLPRRRSARGDDAVGFETVHHRLIEANSVGIDRA